ncbi:collagen alpha-1(I) chain-like [Ursus maritimus]|uniref:Collagen alpha-1(I) chain-like n=1 Tax=Ursus maritimus TaxID=29073 RepID=A0A8M1FID5_URSMA|nr:collagen alpha-1(I) chain-like [Ursus maritimus]
MSDEPDQKFISEPAPRERVPPGLPGPPPRRPRAGERGGAGPGQRGGGGEAPAAREVPGFRADFCVPGRLRHRPRARAGRRGRGRGAAGSPGVLTESTGPDFPAAVAAENKTPSAVISANPYSMPSSFPSTTNRTKQQLPNTIRACNRLNLAMPKQDVRKVLFVLSP